MSNFLDFIVTQYLAKEWNSVWSALARITFFLGKFFRRQKETGSLFPSSHWLCKQMVSEMGAFDPGKGRRYLELGAGSGAVTEEILEKLGPNDFFDIIECDQELAYIVQKLIEQSGKSHQAKIYTVYAQEFKSEHKYDHIFSSLPLTNFSHEIVEKIYDKINVLLKDTGRLSYYEYIGFGYLKSRLLYFLDRPAYDNLIKVLRVKEELLKQKKYKVRRIWGNVFPARVFHL